MVGNPDDDDAITFTKCFQLSHRLSMFLFCSSEGPIVYSLSDEEMGALSTQNSNSMGYSATGQSGEPAAGSNKPKLDLGETNILQNSDGSNRILKGDSTFSRMEDNGFDSSNFSLTSHPVVR